MPPLFSILKPFRAGGNFYNPTDNPVEGDVFKNTKQLVDQRYISPVEMVSSGGSGSSPDPEIAQAAAREAAAGRPSDVGAEGADPAKKARLGSVGAALSAVDGDESRKGGTAAEKAAGTANTGDDDSDDKGEAPKTGDDDPLPDGFPGLAKLDAAGISTYGDLRGRLDTLSEIEGVGPKTAEAIHDALGTTADEK